MKERLLLFLKYLGIGQNSFEKQVGLSVGVIHNMVLGLRTDKLALIAQAYPELNLRWLLLGEGEMLNTDKDIRETEELLARLTLANYRQEKEIEELKSRLSRYETKVG